MKLVTAIIQPYKLDEVKASLQSAGIHGLTASEAKGFGRQKGHTEVYRGAEYTADFLNKVRVEVICEDQDAGVVGEIICRSAQSGKIGDGKVWITHVEDVIRVRTGEHGSAAI